MAATDDFASVEDVISAPVRNAVAVTPDDNNDLGHATRSLYVGGAGDVTVNMLRTGSAILFKAVPVGTVLPIRVTRVKSTGTTATNLSAVW
jgi:hypothetical protein